jgi:predicted AlkP superfamily pyrophosphatase or phosphodiesterase
MKKTFHRPTGLHLLYLPKPCASKPAQQASWRGGLLLALVAMLLGFQLVNAADRHVIMVTIDGFPSYLFDDPKTPIPTIRQLAAEGVVAEGMRASNPTITWPNHTTLVTGVRAARHSVLFNGILQRPGPGLPVAVDGNHDQAELVAVPTVYDLLHRAGLRTAAINWPCTRNSATLDDNFPDVPENVLHTSTRLKQELIERRILMVTNDTVFRTLTGPARDDIWTKAACHVLRERKPNLMLFHLLNTDATHHRYGPQSPASYTALALADFYIRDLVNALNTSGMRENTTLLILADHGFAVTTNALLPNVLLRQAGLLELGKTNEIAKARVHVYPEGGTGFVYLTNPETAADDRKKVMEIFKGREGIAEIIEPAQYSDIGMPLPNKNQGSPDLILVAKDGYGITGPAVGDDFIKPATIWSSLGQHGCMASNPRMNALFVATGKGIKRGGKIGLVENIDVAPTIAHLLGKELPGTDGKVMREILDVQ